MNVEPGLQQVYREHRARMLAALIHVLGDFELAEDALQDACALALRKWGDTVPSDPVAWLLTATRNTLRCCGFYRVPHRRLWRRNNPGLVHPHRRCRGGSTTTDTAMPRPARSGTLLVAASAHRRMLDHPDLRTLPALANGLSASQQCPLGQVHARHMVTMSADFAPRTPCPVVTAGARERFVAARTQRRGSACRYGHHRHTDAGGSVRESVDGFAAR